MSAPAAARGVSALDAARGVSAPDAARGPGPGACGPCLARAGLLARLAGPLDHVGSGLSELLELSDDDLVAAVSGRHREAVAREHAAFDPETARAAGRAAGLTVICRCASAYPPSLRELAAPPAVLHIAGRAEAVLGAGPQADDGTPEPGEPLEPGEQSEPPPAVAVVGARAASPYGTDVARALGRGLAVAGLTVVSGMAHGVDSAAHGGALEVGGRTVAVLGGAAERAYPASARALHARIRAGGAVVSELPPGTATRRWMFPARNRIIAALAVMTVVTEARPGSGALLTAGVARELGRPVGAVPGHVTSPLAAGPHALIRAGAAVIAGPGDVLDALAALVPDTGSGTRARWPDTAGGLPPAGGVPAAAGLPGAQRALLTALAEGQPAPAALQRAGLETEAGLAALAALELAGLIRREPGGRWTLRAR